jgi:hypothetical protein
MDGGCIMMDENMYALLTCCQTASKYHTDSFMVTQTRSGGGANKPRYQELASPDKILQLLKKIQSIPKIDLTILMELTPTSLPSGFAPNRKSSNPPLNKDIFDICKMAV